MCDANVVLGLITFCNAVVDALKILDVRCLVIPGAVVFNRSVVSRWSSLSLFVMVKGVCVILHSRHDC